MRTSDQRQPVGRPLPQWVSRPLPPTTPMVGEHVVVEPLEPARHGASLQRAFASAQPSLWTYMGYGPFEQTEFEGWLTMVAGSEDPRFHAIVDTGSGSAVGLAAYLRIDPGNGSIEVGHISLSPTLQRSTGATEAMWLMMKRAFDELGYRRYEWKCDALNEPSRAAALRLGFTYEGTFRNHMVYKGRNRDTAWFSITDEEWPTVDAAFRRWLDPSNFVDGTQQLSLASIRDELARE